MSLQKKVAGFVLGSGAAQAAIILRGILIARFIGAENMGIAATFVAVTTFIELLSTTGADRFLVQDPEGGEPKAAGTLHAIGAIRGVVLCIILAAIALPAAKLFEAETAIVGYFALALVPLIRGLQSVTCRVSAANHPPAEHRRLCSAMALSSAKPRWRARATVCSRERPPPMCMSRTCRSWSAVVICPRFRRMAPCRLACSSKSAGIKWRMISH